MPGHDQFSHDCRANVAITPYAIPLVRVMLFSKSMKGIFEDNLAIFMNIKRSLMRIAAAPQTLQMPLMSRHLQCFRYADAMEHHNANIESRKDKYRDLAWAEDALRLLKKNPDWLNIYYRAITDPMQLTEDEAHAAERLDVCRRYAIPPVLCSALHHCRMQCHMAQELLAALHKLAQS